MFNFKRNAFFIGFWVSPLSEEEGDMGKSVLADQ